MPALYRFIVKLSFDSSATNIIYAQYIANVVATVELSQSIAVSVAVKATFINPFATPAVDEVRRAGSIGE